MANQLAMLKQDVVGAVEVKVKKLKESGELAFPSNYSPENSLQSAWLILQGTKSGKNDGYKPVLEVCTKDSIANSLLDMVVQGLNPIKKQGYFITYGKQLTFQRSYFGTMAVTKRVANAKTIDAMVIYKGDQVDYEIINSRIVNLVHKQQFGNIDKNNIIGAYATIVFHDGSTYNEVMTMEEIRKAWSKSQMWGKEQTQERKGSVHEEFTQEMAKKTVINRACKKFLNSSDDESLFMKHVNGVDEEEELQLELEEHANGEVIDITEDVELPEERVMEEPELRVDPVVVEGEFEEVGPDWM